MKSLSSRVNDITKKINALTPEERLAGRSRAIAFLSNIPLKTGVLRKVNKAIVMDLLILNTNNRDLSVPAIQTIIDEMNGGYFEFNGDTIRYDTNYTQCDGQTRWYAFLLSALDEIEMMFVTGLRPEAILTIDQGRRRTNAHNATIRRYEQPNKIPAVAKLLRGYKTGDYRVIKKITDRELDAFYKPNEAAIQRAISKGEHYYNRDSTKATATILGACYYLFAEKSVQEANSFFDRLIGGVGLHENSPELTLAKYLTKEKAHLKHSSTQTVVDNINHIIYAWNKCRTGELLKNFRNLTVLDTKTFIDVL
jgi:hypothetical protein